MLGLASVLGDCLLDSCRLTSPPEDFEGTVDSGVSVPRFFLDRPKEPSESVDAFSSDFLFTLVTFGPKGTGVFHHGA